MSETTTYQPAPGITVRQRISVKQTAKGEFTRDYTVEVTGRVVCVGWDGDVPRFNLMTHDDELYSLSEINSSTLRRAEADYQAHIARIRAAEGGA